MPKRKPVGPQLPALPPAGDLFQVSIDLRKQDQLPVGLGVQYSHYRAMPSPVGLRERGDYRRSDALDTISSNGMLYVCAGKFTAAMGDNSTSQKRANGGVADPSTARLVLPRFYDDPAKGPAQGARIYLAPGDRVYVSDPDADVLVANYQEAQDEPGMDTQLAFHAVRVEAAVDSRGIAYECGRDFQVTPEGAIRWGAERNPGVDPDAGQGRVFSVRYLYRAYWYVVSLPKEVRMTATTQGGTRTPQRMPYHAVVAREYVYHDARRPPEQLSASSGPRAREVPPAAPIQGGTAINVDVLATEGES